MKICHSQGPPLSPLELTHLLQLCTTSNSPTPLRQLHQHIILRGLNHHPFILTKLVQTYSHFNDLHHAHKLFEKLPRPNVFAWTAILSLYSRNGMSSECLRAYSEMKLSGVLPDKYVFPKILKACAQLLRLDVGVLVHKDVVVCGDEFNVQVCNSLVDMYAKCGDVWRARRVFDRMVERDLLSWNTMISGFVSNGLVELGVELLGLMRFDGFEPDLVTGNTVMDAYCRMGLCDEAWKIFEQIREPSIISWTTLISGYSRAEKHGVSLGIFREMVGRGVWPDLDSLASVLVSCRHLGALVNGREIHGYGIKNEMGSAFYKSAGAALLTMYARCKRVRDAGNVFELMDKFDVVTWNAMIFGYVDAGLGNLAIECFSKMQKAGIKNDQITLSTVLPVCDLKSGKQIHAFIRKNGFDSVVAVWNALIHMYSKCGCIGTAYSVFSNMVTRDLISWNTIIGGFGMHGLGRAAIQLLQKMNRLGLCPSSVTFTSVLSACSHSGLVDEGLELFDSMTKDFGFIPRVEHFSCAVDLLARAGRLEEAVTFINRMPVEADEGVWGALLAASRAYQNISVGKLAAEHLVHLEPEHAGHYVTLSSIYARAGKWDDAVRVRKLMEGRGLVKPLGNSWIE